jgi:hypothetical protein
MELAENIKQQEYNNSRVHEKHVVKGQFQAQEQQMFWSYR